MVDFLMVLVVQALFMFTIDHKYRLLNSGSVNTLIMFQGIIASMYVVVIPMIAVGGIAAGMGYVLGSMLGTYTSHRLHKDKQ